MTQITFKGWYYDDFKIGDEIVTASRTVTETDIINFAGLTGDWNPLHTDVEFAKNSIFKKRVAHGTLTFAIMTGLLVRTGIIEETIYAFYGVDNLRLTKPVFIGDTLKVIAKVAEKEDRGKVGLIMLDSKVVNQRKEVVLSCILKLLIKKRE
ncbi:dehydratase [Thermococci archaeon]|nr:MAG: dehydratase [Thermococci archaeon]